MTTNVRAFSKSRAVGNEECPKCVAAGGDWDKDNLVRYNDGHGHCFACGYHEGGGMETTVHHKTVVTMGEDRTPIPTDSPERVASHPEGIKAILATRGITASTQKYYGVFHTVNAVGEPQVWHFPYPKGSKFRLVQLPKSKQFRSSGDIADAPLFGSNLFSAGSSKSITITEGEPDAMAVFQMLGSKYPAVSVRSSSSARSDCAAMYDYLNSFEQIYLCFDNDEPGEKAAREVASLFDFNKIFHVKMTKRKDANEYLEAGEQQEFTRLWWNAKRYMPEGVLSSFDELSDAIDSDKDREGVLYPFPVLSEMTYGMAPGDYVLLTAQEGQGKTEVMRAIEHHVLKTTDYNVGIIHLEESKGRTLKGLVGYELRKPVHLPDSGISNDTVKQALQNLLKRDNRLHLYSHFGSDDIRVILDMVQFLAGPCNCRFIFLDHISMVVSGNQGEDERKDLDFLSTRLKMLAKDLGFTLIIVSHITDEGKTRGSRNISKVADLHVQLDRDKLAENPVDRLKTELLVVKNRLAGKTGKADTLMFSYETFTLDPLREGEKPLPF